MKNIVRAIVLIALFSVLFASTAAARGHHGSGMGGGMDTMGMGMRGTGQA